MGTAAYTVNSGAVSCTAATPKTLVACIAAANKPIRVTELGVSFDGVTSSAVPALVELCESDQGTTGTPGSSPTPLQIRGRLRASDATAGIAYSGQNGGLVTQKAWYVPQFNGLFVKQSPLGCEEETLVAASTEAMCIVVTSSATVNCRAYIEFSEG